MKLQFPKITVWRAIFAAIMLSGLYATYLRVMYGLGGSTNLSDKFPWGIWIGFDVMCGVGLAAGGFTLVAMVHIFNIEALQAGAAAGDSDGVSGLLAGGGRPAVRPGAAGPLVASAGDVESALGDVRSGVVRDAVLHGAVPGIPADGVREVRLAQAAGVDPQDLGAADDSGRAAFHAAPEFAGHAVPDRAGEALRAVVHADSAAAVLDLGDCGGPGDDDFRMLAQQPRLWPGAGTSAAGQHGPRAGGADERVPVDSLPGHEPSPRVRPAGA